MRSPADMKIIEIDITNACIHTCSNCTRMCGHHKKNYFMDFETFKRAVDSLDGFEGGIGMMGGEPTLHPEFERFAEYLASKYPTQKEYNYFLQPTANFMRDRKLEERHLTYTHKSENGLVQRIKGPVLFSSLASNYHKYYETIQDTFRYQGVNDHTESCLHQPILVTRKDMGIPDDEWEKMRDNCWMQNVWSASITPKGCFFCEIAGVLDMLFDGPGGWPIEKGWWKRKPEDFKDQLHWCEMCGVALNTRSRDANEGIDDASETMYNKLKEMNTPKYRKGLVNLYTKDDIEKVQVGDNHKFDYHENNMNRLAAGNNRIYPSEFFGVIIDQSINSIENLKDCIDNNKNQFEKMFIFAEQSKYIELIELYKNDANIVIKEKETQWGENLNRVKDMAGELAYIVILSVGTRLEDCFLNTMKKYAINPGSVHVAKEVSQTDLVKFKSNNDYFVLYNPYAKALRRIGYDGVKYIKDINEFIELWDYRKKIEFSNEILSGYKLVNEIEYQPNCTYIVFGTGTYGEKTYQSLVKLNANILCFVDSNVKKQGTCFHEYEIKAPEDIKKLKGKFDKIVIAALAYKEIREIILEAGLTDSDIVAPIY